MMLIMIMMFIMIVIVGLIIDHNYDLCIAFHLETQLSHEKIEMTARKSGNKAENGKKGFNFVDVGLFSERIILRKRRADLESAKSRA